MEQANSEAHQKMWQEVEDYANKLAAKPPSKFSYMIPKATALSSTATYANRPPPSRAPPAVPTKQSNPTSSHPQDSLSGAFVSSRRPLPTPPSAISPTKHTPISRSTTEVFKKSPMKDDIPPFRPPRPVRELAVHSHHPAVTNNLSVELGVQNEKTRPIRRTQSVTLLRPINPIDFRDPDTLKQSASSSSASAYATLRSIRQWRPKLKLKKKENGFFYDKNREEALKQVWLFPGSKVAALIVHSKLLDNQQHASLNLKTGHTLHIVDFSILPTASIVIKSESLTPFLNGETFVPPSLSPMVSSNVSPSKKGRIPSSALGKGQGIVTVYSEFHSMMTLLPKHCLSSPGTQQHFSDSWEFHLAKAQQYGRLIDTLSEPSKVLLLQILISGVSFTDQEPFAVHLLKTFSVKSEYTHMLLMQNLIRQEVNVKDLQKSEAEPEFVASLFRGNSMASTIMRIYGNSVGHLYRKLEISIPFFTYLQSCKPLILELWDPDSTLDATVRKESQLKIVIELSKKLLNHIVDSVSKCPQSIKNICHLIHFEVSKKNPSQTTQALNTFFFTRFICPSLLFPGQDDPLSDNPAPEPAAAMPDSENSTENSSPESLLFGAASDDKVKKALLMVSKVIQAIATFNGQAEGVLAHVLISKFLEEARDVVDDLFRKLCKDFILPQTESVSPEGFLQKIAEADHLKDSFYFLHDQISHNLLRIASVLVPQNTKTNINIINNYKSENLLLWEELLAVLNSLGAPPFLIQQHLESKKNVISFGMVKKVLDKFLSSRPSLQALVSKNILKN